MKAIPHNLTGYFLIHRQTGISYNIDRQGQYSVGAIPNRAGHHRVNFNASRLLAGLQRRVYRLIPKTQPYSVLYKGDYLNVDPRDTDIYWKRRNVLP